MQLLCYHALACLCVSLCYSCIHVFLFDSACSSFRVFGKLRSEALAESCASLLKKFGRNTMLSTQRVAEKTSLQLCGLCGDGSDDSFIVRVWRSVNRVSFKVRPLRAARRQKQFHFGAGSKTLHNFFKKVRQKRRIL